MARNVFLYTRLPDTRFFERAKSVLTSIDYGEGPSLVIVGESQEALNLLMHNAESHISAFIDERIEDLCREYHDANIGTVTEIAEDKQAFYTNLEMRKINFETYKGISGARIVGGGYLAENKDFEKGIVCLPPDEAKQKIQKAYESNVPLLGPIPPSIAEIIKNEMKEASEQDNQRSIVCFYDRADAGLDGINVYDFLELLSGLDLNVHAGLHVTPIKSLVDN